MGIKLGYSWAFQCYYRCKCSLGVYKERKACVCYDKMHCGILYLFQIGSKCSSPNVFFNNVNWSINKQYTKQIYIQLWLLYVIYFHVPRTNTVSGAARNELSIFWINEAVIHRWIIIPSIQQTLHLKGILIYIMLFNPLQWGTYYFYFINGATDSVGSNDVP